MPGLVKSNTLGLPHTLPNIKRKRKKEKREEPPPPRGSTRTRGLQSRQSNSTLARGSDAGGLLFHARFKCGSRGATTPPPPLTQSLAFNTFKHLDARLCLIQEPKHRAKPGWALNAPEEERGKLGGWGGGASFFRSEKKKKPGRGGEKMQESRRLVEGSR